MSSGQPHTSEIVDAKVLAARNAEVSNHFRIADLPRLAELAVQPDAKAHLKVRFHWVDGRCGVAGHVTATLRATCQRCLRPTEVAIDDRFHVVLVSSEAEMSELPETQDSAIIDAAHLDLAWLTEEQLLLAMPLVPLHPGGDCGTEIEQAIAASEDQPQTPFAQLRELMKDQLMKNQPTKK
jgi:uncharacterized protein